jgi:hypothetical protein
VSVFGFRDYSDLRDKYLTAFCQNLQLAILVLNIIIIIIIIIIKHHQLTWKGVFPSIISLNNSSLFRDAEVIKRMSNFNLE